MSEPYTTAQELALKSADAVIVSLKADLQKYMQAFTYANEQNTQLQDERDALRADLDAYQKERDEEVVRLRALLTEARGEITRYGGASLTTVSLLARIDAALKGGGDE